MVKRKSIKEVLDNPLLDEEYYVLVTRYYPLELRKRGMKLKDSPINDWDRDLAPSKELLKDIKTGKINWNEYERRFREEKPIALIKRKLDILQKDAEEKELVLVCIEEEKEYPKCHTWLILELMQ